MRPGTTRDHPPGCCSGHLASAAGPQEDGQPLVHPSRCSGGCSRIYPGPLSVMGKRSCNRQAPLPRAHLLCTCTQSFNRAPSGLRTWAPPGAVPGVWHKGRGGGGRRELSRAVCGQAAEQRTASAHASRMLAITMQQQAQLLGDAAVHTTTCRSTRGKVRPAHDRADDPAAGAVGGRLHWVRCWRWGRPIWVIIRRRYARRRRPQGPPHAGRVLRLCPRPGRCA